MHRAARLAVAFVGRRPPNLDWALADPGRTSATGGFVAAIEAWARDLREKLLSTGGSYELAFGEHTLRGRHDTIFEESGARVLVRVKTGKTATSGADAAADPELALAALGAEARLEYPRHFSYGKPAKRGLSTGEGWQDRWRGEAQRAFEEISDEEMPPRPRSEELRVHHHLPVARGGQVYTCGAE